MRRKPKSRKPHTLNRRLAVPDGEGGWLLRVYKRQPRGRKSARLLVKCGCCDESLSIHYDEAGMEIGGAYASVKEWRRLLLPLLG